MQRRPLLLMQRRRLLLTQRRRRAKMRHRPNTRPLPPLGQRRKRNRHPRRTLRSILPNIKRNMTTISHDARALKFTTMVDGSRGELDYTLNGNVMVITHTRVPPAIRGRGVAAELMAAALHAAQASGWSVKPACSYAVAYMARDSKDADRQHVEDLLDEALDESFPASDSPSVGGSN